MGIFPLFRLMKKLASSFFAILSDKKPMAEQYCNTSWLLLKALDSLLSLIKSPPDINKGANCQGECLRVKASISLLFSRSNSSVR